MKKTYKAILKNTSLFLFVIAALNISGQNIWFNEIHYDNDGGDVDETIEIVLENAGSYTLSDFQIDLYNGNNGSVYDTKTLDQFTAGTTTGGFTFYTYVYPTNGIQNGSPDGMCLSYQGSVVTGQFLSYEGTLTASDGPAAGLTSTDIGVSEPGSTLIGHSLQLTGTGTAYGDFSWLPPDVSTFGTLNNGQSLGGTPDPEPDNYPTNFQAMAMTIHMDLTWTDATGGQLPSAYLVLASDQDNITPPADGTAVTDDTDLSDGSGALNVPYGDQMCTFYNLAGETQYFFEIYPYTNAGSNIDYKTDGTPPAANATTGAIINQNDFESGDFGTWTTYSVASDKDWQVLDFGGALSTTWFAQMNGYQENEPSNDWLISPALDLDSYSNEEMLFYTQWKYGDTPDELTLNYSTDYTGGDPTLATWTELPFNKPVDDETWESSDIIDFSGITGSSVYVAFQYESSGNPRRWSVDEIVITGDATVPVLTVTSPAGSETWEQGSTHDITWTASNTLPNVMIELTTDASSGNPTWTTLASSIPASQGSWTWNISPTQPTSNDCQIRISDMTADVSALSGIFSIIEPIYIPDIVINEIMYNPPESGTDSLEYIELYNNDSQSFDLDGYYFSDGVTFTFPAHTLGAGDYVMVASDSLAFLNFFGETAYEFSGGLSNGGELVLLRHPMGATVDSVNYDDNSPWPTEPDGTGPSLVICDPNSDNSLGENWTYSEIFQGINADDDTVYGSPGMMNCQTTPVPDFTADNTQITVGGSVNFTDLSTGNPTTWEWTFQGGDPTYYTGQNPPSITYNDPGTYSVSLFVQNAAGSNTETKEDYITVGDFPTADFEASEDTIQVGTAVDFTDLSLGDPTSWSWTFEGGTPETSTEQNPSGIVYDAPGYYDVTLYVENAVGDDSLVREEYIKVGYAPVADFEADKDTVNKGETVNFTDLSENDPDTWMWTFDGGTPETSAVQNPENILYEDEGTYDVSLTVENMFGLSEEVKVGYITVVDPVGLEELLTKNMRVYPNPSTGQFNVEHNFEGPVRIDVINMLGSLVHSTSTIEKTVSFDLESLDNGIYFVKITGFDKNSTANGKIIVY